MVHSRLYWQTQQMYIAVHLQINTDPIREKNMFFLPQWHSVEHLLCAIDTDVESSIEGGRGGCCRGSGRCCRCPGRRGRRPLRLGVAGLPFCAARSRPWRLHAPSRTFSWTRHGGADRRTATPLPHKGGQSRATRRSMSSRLGRGAVQGLHVTFVA
jgi:hypothetical protein